MSTLYLSILSQFLAKQAYSVRLEDLYIEFHSHPDFPSFQSITDTLNHFNINSLAASIPKNQFAKLDQAVLVNLLVQGKNQLAIAEKEGDDRVCIVQGAEKSKQVVLKMDEFINLWDGNLIAIDKNKEKKRFKIDKVVLLITFLTVLTLYQQLVGGENVRYLIFQGLAGLGMLVAYLIVKTELSFDYKNSRFCNFTKSTDCEAVINSRSSKVFGAISLSDLCIIYFFASSFSLVLGVDVSFLFWICLLSLPIVIYSIYQQCFILKKWCPLCLGVGIVLCAQFAVLLPYFQTVFETGFLYSLVTFSLVISAAFIAWQLLKPVLMGKKESVEQIMELKSFKRNYRLFVPFYNSLPQLNTHIQEPDLHYSGNGKAPIQILAITNPLCKHCKEVHHMLERLRLKYPEELCIHLRFYTPQTNLNDQRVLLACGMLKAYQSEDKGTFNQLINTWYEKGDVKSFLKAVNLKKAEETYMKIIEEHTKWCNVNQIDRTPVVLINNRVFPSFYHTTDLEHMVGALVEEFKSSKIEMLQPT